tara:strand:+ start:4392 stop:5873 length:1482 start_codon:yes stop_codon:yes gene_type:complete
MATHDYVIANASGAAVRADLNNALAAIVSNNSNATEPATTYAYMWWADTTASQLKLRNSTNDGWIVIQELDGTMLMEDGTAAAPGLAFASDLDTGLFRAAADRLGVAIAGSEMLHIDSDGMELASGERFIIKDNLTGLSLDKTASSNYVGIGWSESDTLGYLLYLENTADSDLILQCRENDVFTATAFQINKANGRIQLNSGVIFPDNAVAYFGTGFDAELFCDGSHLYLDLESGIGNFYIRDGGTTRFTFDDDGSFTATKTITAQQNIVATADYDSNFIANFNNFGNATTNYGINIRAGSSGGGGAGTLLNLQNGAATTVGQVYFSGATVTYGAFTAHHPCVLPAADDANAYPYGTLLEIVEVLEAEGTPASEDENIYNGLYYRVQRSQSSHSRKLLGAYGSRLETPDAPEDGNWHTAYILGDGHVLVNNSGGNIEVGDGIAASATAGIGQKATETPSMIIGIAQEAVTFANDTEEKLVAVQYGVQQFTPWS